MYCIVIRHDIVHIMLCSCLYLHTQYLHQIRSSLLLRPCKNKEIALASKNTNSSLIFKILDYNGTMGTIE